MKTDKISVTYERKWNMGDFSSATVGITLWADLEEGDNPQACTEKLFKDAKAAVRAQSMPLIQKTTAKVQEVMAGLPKSMNGGSNVPNKRANR